MARTALNTVITQVGVTYTVPANKTFVGSILAGGSTNPTYTVNGVAMANLTTGTVLKPVTANAGDVLSCGGGAASTIALFGFLYDN